MMTERAGAETAEWLAATAETELLRFSTAGSVDDGKSTLIGRLLYDSKGVYEDQLASVRKATRNLSTNGLDLSLLTDGLRAEREQGITIDVAYRYFSTPRRKFIIADTPGPRAVHAQHGDRRLHRQSLHHPDRRALRRAAPIAPPRLHRRPARHPAPGGRDQQDGPGGIPRGSLTTRSREDFRAFAAQFDTGRDHFIPMSALEGDNVVTKSARTPWYAGPALLEHLETVPIARDYNLADLRFPVQYVIRPNLDFRGFAGQIASGVIRRGDAITVLPSGRTSRVKSIVTWEGDLAEAFAPMSVTVCLEDEVDISRGDMLGLPGNLPHAGRRFDATVVWMNQKPLAPNRPYLIKQTTQMAQARDPQDPPPHRYPHPRAPAGRPNWSSTASAWSAWRRSARSSSTPTAPTAPPAVSS